MRVFGLKGIFFLGAMTFLTLASNAQSTAVALANLRSDVDRLDQVVRALRLEVENLQRENHELRTWVSGRMGEQQGQFVTLSRMQTALKELEQTWNSNSETQRKSLIKEVSSEIETLAEQTQKAINALAKSIEGQPQVEQVIVFNDNYPKTGTPYTVQSGDSLSRIARELNSKTEWIKNANRLTSDIIYPGQELFVPQEN